MCNLSIVFVLSSIMVLGGLSNIDYANAADSLEPIFQTKDIRDFYSMDTTEPSEKLKKLKNDLKSNEPENSEKKFIILYNDNISGEDLTDLTTNNVEIKKNLKHTRAIIAMSNDVNIEKIKLNKNIRGVFEDTRVFSFLDDSIPIINANQVHTGGITGLGVSVCIVDTGVDDSHPALNTLISQHDFVNDDGDASDDSGHGTHVAGIIASNDSTFGGVAPGSSLMAAKVLDDTGAGWTSDVISGIEWCIANGADVISMSLGGGAFANSCDSESLAIVSNDAVSQGIVVLAASGNDGYVNAMSSPACASDVIAVGAVDKDDSRTIYSNESPELDIVAPGSSITSTVPIGVCEHCDATGFKALSGTSMATPHVSGVVSLLLEADPSLTPADVKTILQNSSLDLGINGYDTIFGFGRVDASSAVDADNDSVSNTLDNCPDDFNPGQEDTDGDGIGDVCDVLHFFTSDVLISGTFTILPGQTAQIDPGVNLVVDETGIINNDSDLTINNFGNMIILGTLNNAGTFNNHPGSQITNSATGTINNNAGTITNMVSAAIVNANGATIENNNAGIITNENGGFLLNTASSTINNNAGGIIDGPVGAIIFNEGSSIFTNNGGVFNLSGGMINQGGATLNNNAGTITLDGVIISQGVGSSIINTGGITVNAAGLLINDLSSTLSNNPGGSITNNAGGIVLNTVGSTLVNSGGSITTSGAVVNAGVTQNSGTITINNEGGLFNIGGVMTNLSGGLITNNLGGVGVNDGTGILNNNLGATIDNDNGADWYNVCGGIINDAGTILGTIINLACP